MSAAVWWTITAAKEQKSEPLNLPLRLILCSLERRKRPRHLQCFPISLFSEALTEETHLWRDSWVSSCFAPHSHLGFIQRMWTQWSEAKTGRRMEGAENAGAFFFPLALCFGAHQTHSTFLYLSFKGIHERPKQGCVSDAPGQPRSPSSTPPIN